MFGAGLFTRLSMILTPAALAAGAVPYTLGASGVAVTAPSNDTNENILATINIPANAMGINGAIEIYCNWSYTNSANAKTLRYRINGISGTIFMQYAPTATLTTRTWQRIQNRGVVNSQYASAIAITSFAATTSAGVSAAVNTALATTIVITGQKAVGTETLRLESYQAVLYPSN